jgi:hypothetical protein
MEIFWQITPGPVRLVNHIDLASSGCTPQVVISERIPFESWQSFPVERIRGASWDDLLTDRAIPLLTHVEIGLQSLRQIREIDEKFHLVLLDRDALNIMARIDQDGHLEVFQVDLEYVYDRKCPGIRKAYSEGKFEIDDGSDLLPYDPGDKSYKRILESVGEAAVFRSDDGDLVADWLANEIDLRCLGKYGVCFQEAEQILVEAKEKISRI